MPVLPNARYEIFAQEVAKGVSGTQAYFAAGYAGSEAAAAVSANRLLKQAKVVSRIAELQGRAAAKAEITVESLLAELEEARQLAIENKQAAAAVAATKERGILSGVRVERSEVGKPGDFARLDDDALDAFIAARAGGAGTSVARTRAQAKTESAKRQLN